MRFAALLPACLIRCRAQLLLCLLALFTPTPGWTADATEPNAETVRSEMQVQEQADTEGLQSPAGDMPPPNWDVPHSEGAVQHQTAVHGYVNNQLRIEQLCDCLRPLDDPDNPYRGLYSPLDFWAYERLKGTAEEPYEIRLHLTYSYGPAYAGYEKPEDWYTVIKTITPEGFLVPQFINGVRDEYRFDTATVGEAMAVDYLAQERWGGTPIDWIAIYAPLDREALELDAAEKRSQFMQALDFPRVPAWLAKQPPQQTIFVPNGDILCYGELGTKYQGGPYYSTSAEGWYRYNRQGRLLESFAGPDTGEFGAWKRFYWESKEEVIDAAREAGTYLTEHRGRYSYVKIAAPEKEGESQVIYDYDGSHVDPETPYDHSSKHLCSSIRAELLMKMFEAQMQMGMVDPTLPSPYDGQADGPQRFSGDPVLPKLVLERDSIINSREEPVRCIARPPSDAANPHAGQYEALDWYLAELALLEPMTRYVKLEEGHYSAYADAVSALNASHGYLSPQPPLPTEFEQTWQIWQKQQADGAVHPSVLFDEQGYMLPTREMYRQALLFPCNVDLRPYELPYVQPRNGENYDTRTCQRFLGGLTLKAPLPPELQTRYVELAREADEQLAPTLPTWAKAVDFYAWLAVPNGEMILLSGRPKNPRWLNYAFENEYVAKIGGYGVDTYVPAVAECLEGMRFERFSAEGEKLDEADARQMILWQSFYWPGLTELIDASTSNSVQDNDCFLRNRCGFVLEYYNPREDYTTPSVLQAAYDYDGTPLDISQPVRRDGACCRWFMKPGVAAHPVVLYDGQIGGGLPQE